MGGVARENGVLKLVHPGGVVEAHKKPITAGEVMKKNPRHWVTRPDVFKFPWVVVSPKSILSLGRVFYIVPDHTMRRLLQSHGLTKNQSSRVQKQQQQRQQHIKQRDNYHSSDDEMFYNELYESQSLIESTQFYQPLREQPLRIPLKTMNSTMPDPKYITFEIGDSFWDKGSIIYKPNNLVKEGGNKRHSNHPEHSMLTSLNQSPTFSDAYKAPKKQYPIEHWPKKHYGSLNSRPVGSAMVPFNSEPKTTWTHEHEVVTGLKSCLRKNKPESIKKVTFSSPTDDGGEKNWDIQVFD